MRLQAHNLLPVAICLPETYHHKAPYARIHTGDIQKSAWLYLWDREKGNEVGGSLEIYPVSEETKADRSAKTVRLPSNMQVSRVNAANPVLKQTSPSGEKAPFAMHIALLTQED